MAPKTDEESSNVAVLDTASARPADFSTPNPTGGSLCESSGSEPPRVSYGPESHTVHADRGSSLDSLRSFSEVIF